MTNLFYDLLLCFSIRVESQMMTNYFILFWLFDCLMWFKKIKDRKVQYRTRLKAKYHTSLTYCVQPASYVHSSTNWELFKKHLCDESSHYEKMKICMDLANDAVPIKWSIHCTSLSASYGGVYTAIQIRINNFSNTTSAIIFIIIIFTVQNLHMEYIVLYRTSIWYCTEPPYGVYSTTFTDK